MRKLNFSFCFKQFSKLIFQSSILMIINLIMNVNVRTTIESKKEIIQWHHHQCTFVVLDNIVP